MAMEVRLSMRKIREILRLRFDCKLTIRQISASIRVSTGAVTKYLKPVRTIQGLTGLYLLKWTTRH